jgi:small subunit ribosomal protein S35
MEYYDWSRNKSKVTATEILNYKSAGGVEPPQEYAKSVEQLLNEGENEYNLDKYREQVVKMLGLNVA